MSSITTVLAPAARLIDGAEVVDMGHGSWALCFDNSGVHVTPRSCRCHFDVLILDGTTTERLAGRTLSQVGRIVTDLAHGCSLA